MKENRPQAIARLLKRLDERADVFRSPYSDDDEILDEAASLLEPFLTNPDRHKDHVRIVVESAVNAAFQRFTANFPLFKAYSMPVIKHLLPTKQVQKNYFEFHRRFLAKVGEVRESLLANVDPGQLVMDVLPARRLETPTDWAAQRKTLYLIQSKTVIEPGAGLEIESISHRIEISNTDIQMVDRFPSTETESVSEQELTVSDRGKFSYEATSGAKVTGGLKAGAASIGSELSETEKLQTESEATASAKVKKTEHVGRVVSFAIKNVAKWNLLRTPTQNLLGENTFLFTCLVPDEVNQIELSLRLTADLSDWGPAELADRRLITLPRNIDSQIITTV